MKCRLPDALWSSQAGCWRQANLIKIARPYRRLSPLPGHPARAIERAAGINGRGIVVEDNLGPQGQEGLKRKEDAKVLMSAWGP